MDDLSAAVSAKLTFEGLIWKNASLLRPCICTSRHNSSRIAIFRSPMRSEISYKIDARPEKNWTKHCPGIPKMLRIQFHIKAGSHQKKKTSTPECSDARAGLLWMVCALSFHGPTKEAGRYSGGFPRFDLERRPKALLRFVERMRSGAFRQVWKRPLMMA
jgi:hypothetical protein